MVTRTVHPEGLTADSAVLTLTPKQKAEMAFLQQQQQNDEEDSLPESPYDRVLMFLGGVKDDLKASVKLYSIEKSKLCWCEDYTPAEFEEMGLDGIRSAWGPGEYEFRLYATDPETGKYTVLTKPRVVIKPRPGEAPGAVMVRQSNSEMSEMLRLIAEGQNRMLQALTEKPPAVDPMVQMSQMFAMMESVKKITGNGDGGMVETIKAIRQLREVADEIVPEKGAKEDSDGLMSMIPQVLSLIAAGNAQQNQQAQQPQQMPQVEYRANPTVIRRPRAGAPIEPANAEIPPELTPEEKEMEDMKLMMIVEMRKQMNHLISLAEKGDSTIDEAADYLVEKLPDELVEALHDPEWFNALKMVAPQAEKHVEWFTKVRAEALPFLSLEDEEQPEETPTPRAPV